MYGIFIFPNYGFGFASRIYRPLVNPSLTQIAAGLAWTTFGLIRVLPEIRGWQLSVVKSSSGLIDHLLLAVYCLSAVPGVAWVFTREPRFAEYASNSVLFAVGSGVLCAGCWLVYLAHRHLGRNYSPRLDLRHEHRLITSGIYRRIRHPLYAGVLLFALGHAITVPNYCAGPAFAVGLLPLVAFRIGREEQMLIKTFGDDYRAYIQSTARLVPGVW